MSTIAMERIGVRAFSSQYSADGTGPLRGSEARGSRSSIEIYDRRRSTCVSHLERGMARSRNADSIGSFGFTGQSITAACSVMVVGPALSALAIFHSLECADVVNVPG